MRNSFASTSGMPGRASRGGFSQMRRRGRVVGRKGRLESAQGETTLELEELTRYSRGDEPADLLIENAKVIDVFGGEILETSVAVVRSRIVGLGDYEARDTLDLEGAFLAPGFIDAHVHVESSLVTPAEFARAVVPLGTTTVVTDPHEIANVLGLDGIRFMFESAKGGRSCGAPRRWSPWSSPARRRRP